MLEDLPFKFQCPICPEDAEPISAKTEQFLNWVIEAHYRKHERHGKLTYMFDDDGNLPTQSWNYATEQWEPSVTLFDKRFLRMLNIGEM